MEHSLVILVIFCSISILYSCYYIFIVLSGWSPASLVDSIIFYLLACAIWYLMFLVFKTTFARSLIYRLIIMFVAPLLASAIFELAVAAILANSIPYPLDLRGFLKTMLWLSPIFWMWGLALLGLTFAVDARERGRLLMQAQQLALEAKIHALRFQLNPHFLHNALNSVSTLILERNNNRAEQMVKRLSHFLRSSLTDRPEDDIPLSRELEVQKSYLEIEMVRFEDQLRTHFEVPTELTDALVPNFLLQPLIENAVKHGLAPYPAATDIFVRVHCEDSWLIIGVINTSTAKPVSRPGTSVGLANIGERLNVRFGTEQSFEYGREGNGFWARIKIPLSRHVDT